MQAARLFCQSKLALSPSVQGDVLPRAAFCAPALRTCTSTHLPSLRLQRRYGTAPKVPRTPATRAPSTQYTLPRRIVLPDAVPQFLRQRRRKPDGSSTFVPELRLKRTTQELERELQWVANNKPSLPVFQEILTILIKHRQIRPKAAYYEALILGNCDPEHGSLENVEALLVEMKDEGIMIGTPVHLAVLKVRLHLSLLQWY